MHLATQVQALRTARCKLTTARRVRRERQRVKSTGPDSTWERGGRGMPRPDQLTSASRGASDTEEKSRDASE